MSLSPTRLRRRSFLNDPPGYSSDLPGHSILLNCPARDPSPDPSSSSHSHSQGHSHAEADAIAAKAALGTVSFAPLPVIPPELKRRSSITLGVAARKNLLSSPEDEIYPDPRRVTGAAGNGRPPQGNGSVRSVYMNDQDWEEYKRQHAVKNGNEVVDIGELVTNQAKNLWRKVKPSPTQQKAELGPDASPSTSTSSLSGGMFSSLTSPKSGTSPGSSNGILGSFSAPKLSMRRRSDPGSAPTFSKETTTKSPELPKVEEESLSRRESAEQRSNPSSPTRARYMEWEKKSRPTVGTAEHDPPSVPSPPPSRSPHGPPSPPPRIQDVLPTEDEVRESDEEDEREDEYDAKSDDDFKGDDGVGSMGLENVEIQSEAGDHHHQKQPYRGGGRDSAVLGFDRSRFGGD